MQVLPKQVVRKIGDKLAVLCFHYGIGGTKPFCTVRAYEQTIYKKEYLGRIYLEGVSYSDIGQNQNAKQEKEAYRLIDSLFPELINMGLKSEGYVKYSLEEVLSLRIHQTDTGNELIKK